jgi:hypothetical protein
MPVLCSPWHLVWTAPRLSPGLRPPPLCRCAVHTKRQGCEWVPLGATRWRTCHVTKGWSMVHLAQRHKGGGSGPRPPRGTAAELSAPSASSRTRLTQSPSTPAARSRTRQRRVTRRLRSLIIIGESITTLPTYFTAPKVSPCTNCFWLNQPNTTIGAIAINDAADSLAQNNPSGLE